MRGAQRGGRRGRALVTGAAGFVGCHVARALVADGWQVAGLRRPGGSPWRLPALPPEMTMVELDLADRTGVDELVGSLRPDLVVHAAARGAYIERDLVAGVRDDLLGFAHLLAALPADGCRLVALGSSLEAAPSREKIANGAPFGPSSTRGALRAAATLLALDEARARRLAAGVLRIFTVYGPWEPENRLVPKAISAAYWGQPLPLTAPPWPTHDYVYAADVAEACLRAAAARDFPGAVWNVCSGRATSDAELVGAVERATGRRVVCEVGGWQSSHPERPYWCGDPEETAAGLGWRAATTLENGLAATAAWWQERQGRPEPAGGAARG